jgi:hypothetical protein
MNRPYYAPHNAPHLSTSDPSVVGKCPPTYYKLSTYKSLKNNFISYLGESIAKDIVPWGFLLPHDKANFGLKDTASNSEAMTYIFSITQEEIDNG